MVSIVDASKWPINQKMSTTRSSTTRTRSIRTPLISASIVVSLFPEAYSSLARVAFVTPTVEHHRAMTKMIPNYDVCPPQGIVRYTSAGDNALERPWKEVFGDVSTESQRQQEWNENHLAHGAAKIHEETEEEIIESEEAAAFDAHDCDDPGMEAAMMERAVMLASEMAHKKKKEADHGEGDDSKRWDEGHLVHGATEIQQQTDEEILDSEIAAAFDAHDCDDPGMEAVMMERAVMLAAEMAHKKKEEAEHHDK